jgi:hypothetical protein
MASATKARKPKNQEDFVMQGIRVVKFLGCWVCIIGAVVLMVLGQTNVLVLPLAVLAIAFNGARETWE